MADPHIREIVITRNDVTITFTEIPNGKPKTVNLRNVTPNDQTVTQLTDEIWKIADRLVHHLAAVQGTTAQEELPS